MDGDMEIIQPVADAFVNAVALFVLVFTAMLFTVTFAHIMERIVE